MRGQFLLIAVFTLNLILIWTTLLFRKFSWYRTLGIFIWFGVLLIMPLLPQPKFYLDFEVWKYAGALAIFLGFGLILWAELEFLKVEENPVALATKLITSGPYNYFRHPQYLGTIFMFVGWCWVWAAVYAFYFGLIILALTYLQAYLEEKLILEKAFGEKYQQYQSSVGMFWIK